MSTNDTQQHASLKMHEQLSSYLAELELVLLPAKLQRPTYKHQDASRMPGWLAIYCENAVLALLEGEAADLVLDVLRTKKFFSLKRKHGSILVQAHEPCSILVKSVVVVLNEGLANGIRVHFE